MIIMIPFQTSIFENFLQVHWCIDQNLTFKLELNAYVVFSDAPQNWHISTPGSSCDLKHFHGRNESLRQS